MGVGGAGEAWFEVMGWRGGWGGIRLPTRRQGKQNTAAPVALTLVVRETCKAGIQDNKIKKRRWKLGHRILRRKK